MATATVGRSDMEKVERNNLENDGNSSDDIGTAEVPEQLMEALGGLYGTSSPEQAEALAAFFTAVSEELRQRDDRHEDGDEDTGADLPGSPDEHDVAVPSGTRAAPGDNRAGTGALGATGKRELAAQLKAAPAAGKPLAGVTVPGVNLQRGAQGGAVKQLQSALVKAGVMTQAQMNSGPGSFGPLTQASLKKFQRAHGVDSDRGLRTEDSRGLRPPGREGRSQASRQRP